MNKPIRTRFAPSPTGHLHIGGARTALYNYLFTRQTGGKFILRLEDTDRKRFVPEAEQEIIDGLHWLGIQWDEGPDIGGPGGPYRQSERKAIYLQFAYELISLGHAYFCFCSPERLEQVRQDHMQKKLQPHYDGTCRLLGQAEAQQRVDAGEAHVIRFKMPDDGAITVTDRLRGEITVENKNLDDSIIVKSDGLALYHLAAMVDDHLMQISHVIRGSEWLPSLPLHSHIIRAFGWEEPEWIHLSVFLKPSGKGKMSKRESLDLMKDGYSIFLKDLKPLGYLPESTINWIALMGWSYDDKTEIFSMQELIEKFSLDHLNPAPAAINFTKFDYYNGVHIRSLGQEDLCDRLSPFFEQAGLEVNSNKLYEVTAVVQERITTLDDAAEVAGFFFRDSVEPDPANLVGKKMTVQESLQVTRDVLQILETLPDTKLATTEPPMRAYLESGSWGAGQVFGILRVAVTGQTVSPPLFESMEIIGREVVLKRVKRAIQLLEACAVGD